MIAGDEEDAAGKARGAPVGKSGPWCGNWPTQALPDCEKGVESDPPQRYHDARVSEQSQLALEVGTTVQKLLPRWLVCRRSTARRGGDEGAAQCESVTRPGRGRLIGEAEPGERFIQPVSAPVTSKHPPGAIAAVGSRGKAYYHKPRTQIAKGGNRSRPVTFPPIPAGRRCGRLLSMPHQARAEPTRDDIPLQCQELRSRHQPFPFAANTLNYQGRERKPERTGSNSRRALWP